MTIQHFKEIATTKHKSYYSYEDVEFSILTDSITINCPVHGDFPQRVINHLDGRGCRKCANTKIADSRSKTTEEFITQAVEVHGGLYNYSKTIYKGCDVKVTIGCGVEGHEEFTQLPGVHTNGGGCQKCALVKRSEIQLDSLEDFIKKAEKIHGDRYDYSLVHYNGSDKVVEIVCRVHGVFPQRPGDHTKGQGCMKCFLKKTAMDKYKDQPTTFYLLDIEGVGLKPGITKVSIKERYKMDKINYKILVEAKFEDGIDAWNLENRVKDKTTSQQIYHNGGDGPLIAGNTEIRDYSSESKIVDILKDYYE